MGAVSSSSQLWSRLQQSGEDPLRGRAASRDGDENDDGSGMAWLKRRRAEREARAREQRERERAEREQARLEEKANKKKKDCVIM